MEMHRQYIQIELHWSMLFVYNMVLIEKTSFEMRNTQVLKQSYPKRRANSETAAVYSRNSAKSRGKTAKTGRNMEEINSKKLANLEFLNRSKLQRTQEMNLREGKLNSPNFERKPFTPQASNLNSRPPLSVAATLCRPPPIAAIPPASHRRR
ncbi:hypothetical protein IEQ34_021335 [Dendrobium chrysotoxum]|uniref:Uncharacterized protein n=1 Tax=Dendrobium chrysotoxum TaxID=161865 RepID=A0AAV7G4M5_DENCH|nr:hypothetical protein IEQ34_021335 [Dendrobium chrysotoxum]